MTERLTDAKLTELESLARNKTATIGDLWDCLSVHTVESLLAEVRAARAQHAPPTPEDVVRDMETVRQGLYAHDDASRDDVWLPALSRLAAQAARVPEMEKELAKAFACCGGNDAPEGEREHTQDCNRRESEGLRLGQEIASLRERVATLEAQVESLTACEQGADAVAKEALAAQRTAEARVRELGADNAALLAAAQAVDNWLYNSGSFTPYECSGPDHCGRCKGCTTARLHDVVQADHPGKALLSAEAEAEDAKSDALKLEADNTTLRVHAEADARQYRLAQERSLNQEWRADAWRRAATLPNDSQRGEAFAQALLGLDTLPPASASQPPPAPAQGNTMAKTLHATCSECDGKRRFVPTCPFCSDSGHDHVCRDEEVTCPARIHVLVDQLSTPTPPPGLREAVGKVLELWAQQDAGGPHVLLETWRGAHAELLAAYDATGGEHGPDATCPNCKADHEDAAKYRAAVDRIDEAVERMPSIAEGQVRDVLEWMLEFDGMPVPATLDKARVVEVLERHLGPHAVRAILRDLGLTLDTPPSGPGGGERSQEEVDSDFAQWQAEQPTRARIAPTPTPEVPPLKPTAPAVVWEGDGWIVLSDGRIETYAGGAWTHREVIAALARALAEAKRPGSNLASGWHLHLKHVEAERTRLASEVERLTAEVARLSSPPGGKPQPLTEKALTLVEEATAHARAAHSQACNMNAALAHLGNAAESLRHWTPEGQRQP